MTGLGRTRRLWLAAWLLGGTFMAAPARPDPEAPTDPAASTTSSVTLEWTSPGDDGAVGTALRYDLRYSLEPITAEDFAFATAATQVPRPASAGRRERVKIRGLEPKRTYYFAVKTVDESGNWSLISNVTAVTAPDAPETIEQPGLAAASLSAPWPNPAGSRTLLELTLPRATDVRIDVVDVSGRLVKTLANGPYPAGSTTFYWDLYDRWGRAMPSGLYWVETELDGRRVAKRLTILP